MAPSRARCPGAGGRGGLASYACGRGGPEDKEADAIEVRLSAFSIGCGAGRAPCVSRVGPWAIVPLKEECVLRENHRKFVQERIDLLWRVRAVLVLAREKQNAQGGWAAGREALRFAAKELKAPSTVVSESLRLAGLRAEESAGVGDNLPEAVAQCSREIRELERELKFARSAVESGFRKGGAGDFLQ